MPALVLLIDDDPEVRKVLRLGLQPLYRVVEATDGSDGWKKVNEHHPAVIIMDLGMPGMNGLDLTEKIKNEEQLRDIPIIILTGATANEELPGGFWKMGTDAEGFLQKPIDITKLCAEIDRVLKEKHNYRPLPPGKGTYD
ncbi:response regulator [bacterium]|nr:response regulator [bacterium]